MADGSERQRKAMDAALTANEKPARQKPSAGWYAHPKMAGTRRYWDGDKWTDHIAPVEQPRAEPKQIGVMTIARGVALGLLIALALLWAYTSLASSNDGLECETRNAERVLGERSGPLETCPE